MHWAQRQLIPWNGSKIHSAQYPVSERGRYKRPTTVRYTIVQSKTQAVLQPKDGNTDFKTMGYDLSQGVKCIVSVIIWPNISSRFDLSYVLSQGFL